MIVCYYRSTANPVFEFSLSPLRIDDDSFYDSAAAAADSAVAVAVAVLFLLFLLFLLLLSERTFGVSPVIFDIIFGSMKIS